MSNSIVYKGYKIVTFEYVSVVGIIKRYKVEGFCSHFDTIQEAKKFVSYAPNLTQYKKPN